MKFGLTFTHGGQLKKLLLNLNDQKVFSEDNEVIKPKDKLVVSLNLDIKGSPASAHTPVETLFQFLSDGETEYGLMSVIGITKRRFKLNQERYEEMLDICRSRLDKNYKGVTWLDISMALMVASIEPRESELSVWARKHLKGIYDFNPDIEAHYKAFLSSRAVPW